MYLRTIPITNNTSHFYSLTCFLLIALTTGPYRQSRMMLSALLSISLTLPYWSPHWLNRPFSTSSYLTSLFVASPFDPLPNVYLNLDCTMAEPPQATLADLAAMLLSNLTTAISSSTAAALLSMKVKVIPYEALLGGLYPTNSRSGSCAAPVPYPQGEEVDVPRTTVVARRFRPRRQY